jgi:catechol 2,3-dioxygenase-like lactoylglutathione lyase family enzyme
MPFHHVALATTDLDATHRFYTEAMGFTLVKTVVAPTDQPDGWAKHVFYDTGGHGLLAFWELHDPAIGAFDPSMATSHGLPLWTNHLAFWASDRDDLDARKQHWLEHGHDVMEIDHGFCVSVYTTDPNGTMVEWCADTRPLDENDRREAETALLDPDPPREAAPDPVFHRAPGPGRPGDDVVRSGQPVPAS